MCSLRTAASPLHAPSEYRRLRVPREDGRALIEPPLSEAGRRMNESRERLAACRYDLGGRTVSEMLAGARRELIEAALRYTSAYRNVGSLGQQDNADSVPARVLLAGHQPELFHPGVWLKNFALSHLSDEQDAVAINLLIDSDVVKSVSIRVPGGTPTSPTIRSIEFDRPTEKVPYEERGILDRDCFASFGPRATREIGGLVSDPLVATWWPQAVARMEAGSNLGEAIAQARHGLEAEWGLTTLELPQSEVCRLESFRWFAAHLLVHLPRFWDVFNSALADYRRVQRIRSRSHPVPDLVAEGNWLEAPFWIWSRDDPVRRPLYARQVGGRLQLTDRSGREFALDITPESPLQRGAEQIAQLEREGIRLRTRALTTTMFARLLMGDLFLHGIGGAKYDQLTDLVLARFFNVEPPDFLVLSATVTLPAMRPEGGSRAAADELRSIDGRLRDLVYHPERQLDRGDSERGDPRRAQLLSAKRNWIETHKTAANARRRHEEIAQANQGLQPYVEAHRAELEALRHKLENRLRSEAILGSREYAFCLHPGEELRELLLDFLPASG